MEHKVGLRYGIGEPSGVVQIDGNPVKTQTLGDRSNLSRCTTCQQQSMTAFGGFFGDQLACKPVGAIQHPPPLPHRFLPLIAQCAFRV